MLRLYRIVLYFVSDVHVAQIRDSHLEAGSFGLEWMDRQDHR
jgi:hypothetical protein